MRGSARFANRTEAGKQLAAKLTAIGLDDPVVLALPRGGVPVGVEIARALAAPLDLVLVRKIGVPFEAELAAAAVVDGSEPEIVINEDVIRSVGMTTEEIESQAKLELAEIERRRNRYLAGRTRVALAGRTLILVDDGIATGASMRAAIVGLRRKSPRAIVLAVPVAARETLEELRGEVDDIICLHAPKHLHAIGLHYDDFHQVSDDEVIGSLSSL